MKHANFMRFHYFLILVFCFVYKAFKASLLGIHSPISHTFQKKNIIIFMDSEPVSQKSFIVNPFHHCFAGPTPHGGPQLVRLLLFFFNKIKKKVK